MDAECLDVHVHFDYGADIAAGVEAARRAGILLAVSGVGPMFCGEGNDAVEDALRKYPDTVIGMGYVALGRGDSADTVDDLHRRGFKGLKVIAPKKDYDDAEYFPIYARAEELGMPMLFHTGVIARSDTIIERRAAEGKPVPPHDDPRTFDIASRRMEPMCVDTIARAFPKLNCIMAHFGSTGRRDVSEGIIKWNPNVYGDLTSFSSAYEIDAEGWHIEKKYLEGYLSILRPLHPERLANKLLYGTDSEVSRFEYIAGKKASHKALYDALGLDEEQQRGVFYDTAARLLGLE